FRNGERSALHHPEFTMLEWYRAGAGYEMLIEDCQALVRAAFACGTQKPMRWRDRTSDPRLPWEIITVAEAFERHADLELFRSIPERGRPDRAALASDAGRIGGRVADGDSWDDLFFRIFLERIEPKLGEPAPTILKEYPVHMAALSRPKPSDPRVAERFE